MTSEQLFDTIGQTEETLLARSEKPHRAALWIKMGVAVAAVLALLQDKQFAKEFFIVADLEVSAGTELAATAAMTPHAMCPRCRRYEPAVNEDGLCERCAAVMA